MSTPFIPREYQKLIIDQHLDVPRCATWAGMGMGKTSATLSSLELMYMCGHESKPALVLAPKRVAQSTWPDEAKKWDHLRNIEVAPIIGTEAERKLALRNKNASVFTINYENLPWLMETLDGAWPFGPVVSDESTKLKGYRSRQGSLRAKALGSVAHTKINRFIELTGTPSPNGLVDLWGQAWFLDQGIRLGRSFAAFQQRWFITMRGETHTTMVPQPFAQVQIQERLKDICMTLEAKDYFDIKEPIVSTILVDLPARAREIYRGMEREMFANISGHDVEAFNAGAKSAKCHQIANGAAYIDPVADSDEHPRAKQWREVHDEKILALESIIEESGGMPVLVAYHFKSDLARLQKAFPKGRVLDDNPQTIRDWNAGKVPVLFAHPASAGHGLNLQDGGNIVAYFSIDWNMENHLQILERIGPTRQLQSGYDRPVFVYFILARDTVDEQIKDRLEGKGTVQQLLLDSMKRKQK
jgi:SNF2 family DNA or RNA helicase